MSARRIVTHQRVYDSPDPASGWLWLMPNGNWARADAPTAELLDLLWTLSQSSTPKAAPCPSFN